MSRKKILSMLMVLIVAVAFSSCGSKKSTPITDQGRPGRLTSTIVGVVEVPEGLFSEAKLKSDKASTTQNSKKPLSGATITMNVLNKQGTLVKLTNIPQAVTNAEGKFTITNVPEGNNYVIEAKLTTPQQKVVKVYTVTSIEKEELGKEVNVTCDPITTIAYEAVRNMSEELELSSAELSAKNVENLVETIISQLYDGMGMAIVRDLLIDIILDDPNKPEDGEEALKKLFDDLVEDIPAIGNAFQGVMNSGSISGIVKDKVTAKPIPNASVKVSKKISSKQLIVTEVSGYTDEKGSFFILNAKPGEYTISAERSDYEKVEKNITVEIGKDTFVEFSLNKIANANIPPKATASADKIEGTAPLTVQFTGSGEDQDGTIVSYSWDFGDGNTAQEQNPTHTYKNAGIYTALLTVTDNDGAKGYAKLKITVKSSIVGIPKIAVVTGHYDAMENVLAKIGLGEVNENGNLIPGTEKFTIINGTGMYGEYAKFSNSIMDFKDFVLNDHIAGYDIVFINCGNVFEYDLLDSGNRDTTIQNIKNFVSNGGRLYVTDLSYDFVEQVFPEYIDFYGDLEKDGLSNTPEEMGAAQRGYGGIWTNGTILDSSLKSWLSGFAGVLNSDGTVKIRGLLGGWVVIDDISSSTKKWVEGKVKVYTYTWNKLKPYQDRKKKFYYGNGEEADGPVEPLTVTFNYGKGRVLYTSYHTHEEGGTSTGLTPQERILQYLVFEIAK